MISIVRRYDVGYTSSHQITEIKQHRVLEHGCVISSCVEITKVIYTAHTYVQWGIYRVRVVIYKVT